MAASNHLSILLTVWLVHHFICYSIVNHRSLLPSPSILPFFHPLSSLSELTTTKLWSHQSILNIFSSWPSPSSVYHLYLKEKSQLNWNCSLLPLFYVFMSQSVVWMETDVLAVWLILMHPPFLLLAFQHDLHYELYWELC